jgi:hypothetical protein
MQRLRSVEELDARQRYIDAEGLRDAARRVVNATLAACNPVSGARA